MTRMVAIKMENRISVAWIPLEVRGVWRAREEAVKTGALRRRKKISFWTCWV